MKVECQNKYCGKNTWVKWGFPSNCEHCGHPVITPMSRCQVRRNPTSTVSAKVTEFGWPFKGETISYEPGRTGTFLITDTAPAQIRLAREGFLRDLHRWP